jgi:chromosome segregation ATPase
MFNFYKIAGTRVGEEIEKLRSDDLSQEETMASLRLEIEALTEEKKFLKAEAISKIRTLERELALFKTTSSYDVINNERNALKDEISNLNKLVQISNEEKQIQITKLAALETEMMTIKTAASNTDREMNTRLNAERSLNESLKQEIIMLKHKYDDAMIKEESNNKEKDMFNNTINDLRDKIRILEESANIEKSTRLTEDKSQKEMIEKCQSEIAKLNKENGAMRKEVETLRKENDKILKEKTAMDATIKELEKKVKDYDVE